MHVIIFSIDKNYELYQELEEGRKMRVLGLKKFSLQSKNPPYPLKKGESAELDFKQILVTQKSSFIINGW